MPHGRQRLGAIAEDLAAAHLAAAGCRVLARNARIRYAEIGIAGELDLIALEGRTLAVVEVKAMRSGASRGPGRAVLAVDHRKQRRIRRLARAWLFTNPAPWHEEIRFDVVGVTFDADGTPRIEWLRGAF
jgi:putative endonuclease